MEMTICDVKYLKSIGELNEEESKSLIDELTGVKEVETKNEEVIYL